MKFYKFGRSLKIVLAEMTEVDVFTTNFTLVDPEIYQLWIEGHTGSKHLPI